MKKTLNMVVVILSCLAYLSGCATILSKNQYPVKISSKPDGAEITIKNKAGAVVYTGKTPTTITLNTRAGYFQGETYQVSFKKDGFAPHSALIERGVDGFYLLGNLLVGGLVGWIIVDPLTGAMWTLSDLHVDLDPLKSATGHKQVKIVTVDDVPQHLLSKMVRIN